nr:immunoglobulin light chain junction region [Macaca mulatta]MOX08816.1 immunoglobulin light chain junction region [Macaca mulatta]MOX08836.1 immunoglobulin light chain junction region [Macaca mulatta]
CQQHNTYPTF